MSKERTFVGFGFGAIQAGLFLYEAFRSGRFDKLVVAEIIPDVVRALNDNGGRYMVNIATASGIEQHEVSGVILYNPKNPHDRDALVNAVAEASEIATALPSVDAFGSGKAGEIHGADLIAALFPYQYNFVANLGAFDISDIDHRLVHRDPADN